MPLDTFPSQVPESDKLLEAYCFLLEQHGRNTQQTIENLLGKLKELGVSKERFLDTLDTTKARYSKIIKSSNPDRSINFQQTGQKHKESQQVQAACKEMRERTNQVISEAREQARKELKLTQNEVRIEKVLTPRKFDISDSLKASLEKYAQTFLDKGHVIPSFYDAKEKLSPVYHRDTKTGLTDEEIHYFFHYFKLLKNGKILPNKK